MSVRYPVYALLIPLSTAPSGTQNRSAFVFVCLLGFCYMVQDGLKLSILLSHLPERWCDRCVAPCPAPSVIPFLF